MQCPGMPCGPCLPKVWYGCETESGNARVESKLKGGDGIPPRPVFPLSQSVELRREGQQSTCPQAPSFHESPEGIWEVEY